MAVQAGIAKMAMPRLGYSAAALHHSSRSSSSHAVK
jgi:hypothetical protein